MICTQMQRMLTQQLDTTSAHVHEKDELPYREYNTKG